MHKLSKLNKTWIIDIDGTIVKHNGYVIDGFDTILGGVKEFFNNIDNNDKIILLTARQNKDLTDLKKFLKKNKIRYDYLLADMPVGERILINDKKPSGLKTAYAVNKVRDKSLNFLFKIDETL